MRKLLISTGAALLALAATATPAYAQFGGSPDQQIDRQAPEPGTAEPEADADADEAYPVDMPDLNSPDDQAPDDDQGYDAAADEGPIYGSKEEAEAAGPGDGGGYDAADQGDDVTADDAEEAGPGDAYEGVDAAAEQNEPGDQADQGESESGQTWQGQDGQTYCRRSDGTTGLIVGGGAGALVGRGIDGGRHRGTGTILGAIAGAIVGSAVERSANQQSCR
jgi:hypothetical protein